MCCCRSCWSERAPRRAEPWRRSRRSSCSPRAAPSPRATTLRLGVPWLRSAPRTLLALLPAGLECGRAGGGRLRHHPQLRHDRAVRLQHGAAGQRAGRAARRRGRGRDPWHRHHGGDQLPRRSAAAIGQAGRVHRCAARARRSAVGWPTQPAERLARGGIATRRRARSDGLLQRDDPRSARRYQGSHQRRRDVSILRARCARRSGRRSNRHPSAAGACGRRSKSSASRMR